MSVGVIAIICIILHPLAHAIPCSFSDAEIVLLSLLQWVPYRGCQLLTLQGAVRITWSPPTDLCGLNNPQYGRSTSTTTTHPSMPSSSPFDIAGLEVGQEYFVRLAVSGSDTFSVWVSVTTPCKGVRVIPLCYLSSTQ